MCPLIPSYDSEAELFFSKVVVTLSQQSRQSTMKTPSQNFRLDKNQLRKEGKTCHGRMACPSDIVLSTAAYHGRRFALKKTTRQFYLHKTFPVVKHLPPPRALRKPSERPFFPAFILRHFSI